MSAQVWLYLIYLYELHRPEHVIKLLTCAAAFGWMLLMHSSFPWVVACDRLDYTGDGRGRVNDPPDHPLFPPPGWAASVLQVLPAIAETAHGLASTWGAHPLTK